MESEDQTIGKKDNLNKYCDVGKMPTQITTSDIEKHINDDENEHL
jgi:hypothetical protein